jgi:hypothetical protein
MKKIKIHKINDVLEEIKIAGKQRKPIHLGDQEAWNEACLQAVRTLDKRVIALEKKVEKLQKEK